MLMVDAEYEDDVSRVLERLRLPYVSVVNLGEELQLLFNIEADEVGTMAAFDQDNIPYRLE